MMNETLKTILERRSTRAFRPEQISREALDTILDAALWAPSGMGTQHWHFAALHSAEKTQALARAVAKADNRGDDYNFYGAPCIVLVSCPRDDQHAYLNGGAAMENILLAAQALGLGACWINQVRATCGDPAVRALLTSYGVPEAYDVVASAALGQIETPTAAKPRKAGLISIVE